MARARLLKMDEVSIGQAAQIVSKGGLIAYPTDTVYGLGCDPFNSVAVRKLVEAKRRVKGGLPVLVDCSETARELGEFNPTAVQLADNFWPGGLTIVVPLAWKFPAEVPSGGTIGFRMPDRVDTLQLIRDCGSSLIGTSANISGMPSANTAKEVLTSLGGEIDVVLDGGASKLSKGSTVVRVMGHGCLVLREGAVRIELIRRVCPILESE